VSQGHAGRCIKVWAKVAGCKHVFAMGWPGVVECIVKGKVDEPGAERAIMASFGLDDLKLGVTVEEVYGHDWIGDPYSKGTWLALRPGQPPTHDQVESRWTGWRWPAAQGAATRLGGWSWPRR